MGKIWSRYLIDVILSITFAVVASYKLPIAIQQAQKDCKKQIVLSDYLIYSTPTLQYIVWICATVFFFMTEHSQEPITRSLQIPY